MRAFVIRSSDIDRCPIRSFSPEHYREDGSCLHVPPVDAPARPAQAVRPIKALSLIQPYASLVDEGIKTVESRSWQTHYRGPLAIAASASIPTDVRHRVLGHRIRGRYNSYGQGDARILNALYVAGYEDGGVPDGKPLPLGCVVATCTLVDVVPTGGVLRHLVGGQWRDSGTSVIEDPFRRVVRDSWAQSRTKRDEPWGYTTLIDYREWSFGDYSPGRFAWLLSDVVKIDPPVPVKGRQGLWEWTPPEGGPTQRDTRGVGLWV